MEGFFFFFKNEDYTFKGGKIAHITRGQINDGLQFPIISYLT